MAAGNLEGKVIAITGGASGMGLATAKLLSSRGAILALADLNQAGLDEIATTIRSQGGKVVTRVTDVRNPDQVNAFIDTAVAEYGKLDGAVNMAGILGKNAYKHSVEELSLEEWELIMGVNATGTFNSLKKELQVIVDGGSIVNVGSILSIRGSANNPAYAASKHAVLGLSRSAAKSAGSRGVRVNVIAPYVLLLSLLFSTASVTSATPNICHVIARGN